MNKNSGFTMLELMIAIAIMIIGAAIAVPNMIQWRTESSLRGSANNLRADLNMAKMLAIRENAVVVVDFSAGDRYVIFVDNGAGSNAEDWVWQPAEERRVRNRDLRPGISFDLVKTDFLNDRTRFNRRGLPDQVGKVVLVSNGGEESEIAVNQMGRVNLH